MICSINHQQADAEMLKVEEHSELLYALYLVRCPEPANGSIPITTRDPQEKRMKEISQHCRTNDNSERQEGNIPSNSTHAVWLLSTHSLDPCLWGESDHHASGPSANLSHHLASSSTIPSWSVYKSRGDNVMRMWVELKR